jgi:ribosomal protein L11 methylase PrmA
VANIQTAVLVPLLEGFAEAAKHWLILGGITESEWPLVVRSAEAAGFVVQALDAEEEWRSGWFEAPS